MAMLYYESSLAHYGVIGMKWGIRRGSSLHRMSKISKNETRAARYALKSSKYDQKSQRTRNKTKADDLSSKSRKYDVKSKKLLYKIEKDKHYIEKMTKKMSSLTPEDMQVGKDVLDEYFKRYHEFRNGVR